MAFVGRRLVSSGTFTQRTRLTRLTRPAAGWRTMQAGLGRLFLLFLKTIKHKLDKRTLFFYLIRRNYSGSSR